VARSLTTEVEEMGRQSPNAGSGGRTQQAGTLLAATVLPITSPPGARLSRAGMGATLVGWV
jgi:hypothetical protein